MLGFNRQFLFLLTLQVGTVSSSWRQLETGENSLTQEERENLRIGIFAITLDEHIGHVNNFLEKNALKDRAVIFPAVRKDRLQHESLIATGELGEEASLSPGEIACSMSHRGVLESFLKNESLSHALIFEDDAEINPMANDVFAKSEDLSLMQFIEELAATSKELKWDALNLGRCWAHCRYDKYFTTVKGFDVVHTWSSLCTHAGLFTRKGAQTHLRNTMPIRQAEDVGRQYAPNFRYLSISPRMFVQKENRDAMSINKKVKKLPECGDRME
mmetsp:Transcript_10778/g.14990  ORF Transcript_10778/g.14990 Transcript_10778/m.14990 type:complete len:272 (+) Transcript_10778:124-939(+)|eukprot:CAMPEP_0184484876 /NCGR_PEP_ID=MMETSP0113_2-20130426/6542_1 /TAXON_ID=91329 /ORGANISM="Norrisiella sphaerica, Strain BC52" /LENGTH=271 /DNA_ID=CAMNT_0026866061 /DNA_START=124 /DNA_END=939 /DNA_ORIENTATION=-